MKKMLLTLAIAFITITAATQPPTMKQMELTGETTGGKLTIFFDMQSPATKQMVFSLQNQCSYISGTANTIPQTDMGVMYNDILLVPYPGEQNGFCIVVADKNTSCSFSDIYKISKQKLAELTQATYAEELVGRYTEESNNPKTYIQISKTSMSGLLTSIIEGTLKSMAHATIFFEIKIKITYFNAGNYVVGEQYETLLDTLYSNQYLNFKTKGSVPLGATRYNIEIVSAKSKMIGK